MVWMRDQVQGIFSVACLGMKVGLLGDKMGHVYAFGGVIHIASDLDMVLPAEAVDLSVCPKAMFYCCLFNFVCSKYTDS